MDLVSIYHFFFETFAGIGCLIGICLILSLVACVIMERRTRKQYANHEKTEDDWSFFDSDDEDEDEGEGKGKSSK